MLVAVIAKLRGGKMLQWRQQEQLTQTEAAKMAGVSLAAWGKAETMQFQKIGWYTIRKIAECVGCAADEICPEELKELDQKMSACAYRDVANARLLAQANESRLCLPPGDDGIESEPPPVDGLLNMLKIGRAHV